jgi:isopentenyl-diphosphate delta-isomerase
MSAPGATSPIDLVDANDQAFGVIPRGEALRRGANFRTAHVLLFDATGRLLLQRLAEGRERHPGRWGSSIAAYLHAGEDYREAAQRRLAEELGLHVRLKYVGKVRMADQRSVKFIGVFTGLDGPAQIHEPDHIAALRYWALDELDAVLRAAPDQFTPTFIEVYSFLRSSRLRRRSL